MGSGCPARVLVAGIGVDRHDRGGKVLARALRDAGMDVIYAGLPATPDEVVAAALQEDVDVIGVSVRAGEHSTVVPQLLAQLRAQGVGNIGVFVGGIIPDEDVAALRAIGVADVVVDDTPADEIVQRVRAAIAARAR